MVIPGGIFEEHELIYELIPVDVVAVERSVYVFFYDVAIRPNESRRNPKF